MEVTSASTLGHELSDGSSLLEIAHVSRVEKQQKARKKRENLTAKWDSFRKKASGAMHAVGEVASTVLQTAGDVAELGVMTLKNEHGMRDRAVEAGRDAYDRLDIFVHEKFDEMGESCENARRDLVRRGNETVDTAQGDIRGAVKFGVELCEKAMHGAINEFGRGVAAPIYEEVSRVTIDTLGRVSSRVSSVSAELIDAVAGGVETVAAGIGSEMSRPGFTLSREVGDMVRKKGEIYGLFGRILEGAGRLVNTVDRRVSSLRTSAASMREVANVIRGINLEWHTNTSRHMEMSAQQLTADMKKGVYR